MKLETTIFGSFRLIAETGQDALWLADFVKTLADENTDKPHVRIDFESCCQLGDNRPATDMTLKEAISTDVYTTNTGKPHKENYCWGEVTQIDFSAMAH